MLRMVFDVALTIASETQGRVSLILAFTRATNQIVRTPGGVPSRGMTFDEWPRRMWHAKLED